MKNFHRQFLTKSFGCTYGYLVWYIVMFNGKLALLVDIF